MKVLITGISGFAGSHLTEYLLEQGHEIAGTYLDDKSIENLPKDSLNLKQVNLLDEDSVADFVKEASPDHIYHLAALTSPKSSFDNPTETFVNNISAQINLFQGVKKHKSDARILVVSSAEIYGLVTKENLPIDEDTPFNPTNPYAVSKLAQDFLGLQYALSGNLDVVRVRPFNHIGPRQSDSFVVSAFSKRIAEIEAGKSEVMKIGNLSSKRDFTDVRDMVKAYLLALEKGETGEVYNLGSGMSYPISEVLQKLISISSVEIKKEEDQSLMIPSDNPELICDYTKFNQLTGWKPEIPIDQTLNDTLDYWRNII